MSQVKVLTWPQVQSIQHLSDPSQSLTNYCLALPFVFHNKALQLLITPQHRQCQEKPEIRSTSETWWELFNPLLETKPTHYRQGSCLAKWPALMEGSDGASRRNEDDGKQKGGRLFTELRRENIWRIIQGVVHYMVCTNSNSHQHTHKHYFYDNSLILQVLLQSQKK